MIVGIPKEIFSDEARVAVIPSGVADLVKKGFDVVVQAGAGDRSHIGDDEFRAAGASLAADAKSLYEQADLVLKVRVPTEDVENGYHEADLIREGASLICMMDAYYSLDVVQKLAARKVRSFALEFIPRITRAQSMDVLSSMAAISGYRGVLAGAMSLPQYFPMLMTAAGTITPAKVFIIGAGVAGLMAISTARRLGAVVEAYDTRSAAREQVESLGAKFVEFDLPAQDDKATGGYAKAQSEEFYRRQREQMAQKVAQSNLIVTTALIPGREAPKLITADMLHLMKKGSVIVDLAAERGGNVEGTVRNEKVYKDGVTIIGYCDHPSRVPVHASQLYSKNITTFLYNMSKDGELELNLEDEIVSSTMLTADGDVVHAALKERLQPQEAGN
ncbi:Re/Si-specific NAD(P)(+) transhydrogenase subunit alpha [Mangrovitalea sediminis]|uniref:Re/Si-specific NAD(P)(+) transhydrogenase subunit alpha n=1 Tax=Mangrovitalea sediminis TaxID=1982043 RepID=UPI000BE535BD|nr:Re/Si-specific NAD(P)(+) transhydrogenase subunit alpha [Mangrovitalea sediminis]